MESTEKKVSLASRIATNLFAWLTVWTVLGIYLAKTEGGLKLVAIIGWLGLFGAMTKHVPKWNGEENNGNLGDALYGVTAFIVIGSVIGGLIVIVDLLAAKYLGVSFHLVTE